MLKIYVIIKTLQLLHKNRNYITMKLTILRIENRIVTCELEDGTLIYVARRWLTEDIQEYDTIEFDVYKCKNNE